MINPPERLGISLLETAPTEIINDQWAVSPARILRESLKEGSTVLEIGPGPSKYENLYRGKAEVVLLDINHSHLKIQAHDLGKVRGAIESLPFPDNTFESVVAANLPARLIDWNKAISEVERVLKPGGLALFSLANFSNIREVRIASLEALDQITQRLKVIETVKRIKPGYIKPTQFWILARKEAI